jgi:ribosomal protein S6--L-glutamate ligase
MRLNKFIVENENKFKVIILTTHKEKESDEDDTYRTVKRLKNECVKRKIECHVVFAEDSYIERDEYNIPILKNVKNDGIIILDKNNTVCFVRGSVSKKKSCIDLLSQIERHEIFCINHRNTIEQCSDKFRTILKLADANIPVPKTALISNENGMKIAFEKVGNNFPVVLKTLTGSKGVGVFTANDWPSLKSTMQTIWKISDETEILIQEYIESDYDIRVHVLGNDVIAAMKRYKIKDDFRSNYSLGGEIEEIKLTKQQEEIAIYAAKAMNATWSGVDMMMNGDTPMIIEVNSSPGTEGIEKATGKNIVGMVIDYISNRKNWTKKTIECGFVEKIKVNGIGYLSAKFDTGNGAIPSIHADSWEIKDGNKIIWHLNGNRYMNTLEDVKDIEVGGLKNKTEKRPVICLTVEFMGEIYNDMKFALSNRAGYIADVLLNRNFIKSANLVINPAKKYILTTPKE